MSWRRRVRMAAYVPPHLEILATGFQVAARELSQTLAVETGIMTAVNHASRERFEAAHRPQVCGNVAARNLIFTEQVAGLGIAPGDLVPGSSEWAADMDLNYEHPITAAVSGFARAHSQYIGASHGTFVQSSPDYQRASYTLLGASLGITAGAWEFSVYAKNILDDRKIIQSPADNFVAEGGIRPYRASLELRVMSDSDSKKWGLLAAAILGSWVSAVGWSVPAAAAGDSRPFATPWMDATHGPEPETQVQRYDANTYIVRQSLETNFEGPFIFLFFGGDRVLQIDSGAGGLKIRPTVDRVITDWLHANGKRSIQLVVAHSHSHHDHVAGDEEFTDRADTVVVGHSPEEVATFFKVHSWPADIVPFDLGGGRVVDIIPSPGHEPAEISVYDRKTHLLLMGDELYPGRLYIPSRDFKIYQASVDRVGDFTRSRPVAWILGNHIEMTQTPGRDYAMHIPTHPLEHRLELPHASLLELRAAVDAMGDLPRLEVHDDFIIYPLP